MYVDKNGKLKFGAKTEDVKQETQNVVSSNVKEEEINPEQELKEDFKQIESESETKEVLEHKTYPKEQEVEQSQEVQKDVSENIPEATFKYEVHLNTKSRTYALPVEEHEVDATMEELKRCKLSHNPEDKIIMSHDIVIDIRFVESWRVVVSDEEHN